MGDLKRIICPHPHRLDIIIDAVLALFLNMPMVLLVTRSRSFVVRAKFVTVSMAALRQ
jgi:hypothetical protein